MIVLGIDTSCDDTSVALLEAESLRILAEGVSSRMELHTRFGGVVPEIAARQHLELLLPMVEAVLAKVGADRTSPGIDLIAVTRGPGLIGALLVGFSCAKALSMGWRVPFVGVNHIEGHLVSAALDGRPLPYPHIALVISGGHSELYRAEDPSTYYLLGETRDDAVGELLDKTGRLLGVPFPAGRTIDEWALNSETFGPHPLFPRPLIDSDSLEFSFSGLKTACLYFLRSEKGKSVRVEAVGAEVLRAAVDSLVAKALLACRREKIDTLAVSGGVAASRYLRREFAFRCQREGLQVIFPEPSHCTDNAAMIALAGLYRFKAKGPDSYDLDCDASLCVGSD